MRTSVSRYHRHRFPAEIISHCVWLYFRFALSFRDVEEMLAMRGVSLSYETVREWCLKFGQTYANGLVTSFLNLATDGILMKCSSKSTDVSIPLASSGSGWGGIGYFSPEQAGQGGSKEVLSQALKTIALRPACDRHRQAAELQCCQNGTHAERRTRPTKVSKQPSGEFTSTD
jgi:hypothetical protein